MKFKLFKSDGSSSGETEIDNFPTLEDGKGDDALRQCILAVRANKRQGNASTKTRDEVSGSGKKIYRQKGTGGARHGDRNAPIFRKGGIYKGPTPRSHGHELPKKVRKLGLKLALSAMAKSGSLVIIENAETDGKTSALAKQVKNLGWKRALVIDGASVNEGFARAARNIEGLDVLPSVGANVFDILKRDTLVITKAGVEALEARLK